MTTMSERTPVERYLAEKEVGENPLAGRPLPERPRLTRVELDRYLPALGGPLPHMRRLRQIDADIDAHQRALGEAWRELAAECANEPERFRRRWRGIVDRWSFRDVNDLIERHNAYYPIEARLPMDPRSGDFVPVLGRSYRRDPLDARWALERFPPELVRVTDAA
jgi:hypothetical protein